MFETISFLLAIVVGVAIGFVVANVLIILFVIGSRNPREEFKTYKAWLKQFI